MSSSKSWEATERAGLGEPIGGEYVERLLRVPFDPDDTKAGEFDLFYFKQEPQGPGRGLKTVLFCAGGPGQIVRPLDDNFLRFLRDQNTAYRVVHLHLRGSGFSQFPPSSDFDRFLRTRYAVNDIEQIRKDVLGDEPWDGIVGYSYGTVLAQQYASWSDKEKKKDKEKKERVRKLILIGPLSMHKFTSAPTPALAASVFDEYTSAEREIIKHVLKKIIEPGRHKQFEKLDKDDRAQIETKLPLVLKQIEEEFGSEQFVFEQYGRLKGKLKEVLGKDYSPNFFKQLRALRMIGWQNPDVGDPEKQIEAGRVIVAGLMPEMESKKVGEVDSGEALPLDRSDESYRTHYVMQIYDGVRPRFLKALAANHKQNITDSIRESTGRVGGTLFVHEFVEKIGIAKDKPSVWDPKESKHGIPTLILKGEADPVTAVGQAEYYCEEALTGPRILLKLEGVGHGFYLPKIKDLPDSFLVGSVRVEPGIVKAHETKEVTGFMYCTARLAEDTEDSNSEDAIALRGRDPSGVSLDFEEAIILSETEVSVLVYNSSPRRASTQGVLLILRHPLFEGKVALQSTGIPPVNESWVRGTLKKSKKKLFVVRPPTDLKQEQLRFIPDSAEFEPPDKLMLKIENISPDSVTGKPRNWIYVPTPGNKFIGPCQGEDLDARNALIYAFLEMEFMDFANQKAEILEKIKPFLAGIWIHDGDKWKVRLDNLRGDIESPG
jgi:pimeloyl-ACP methyl ester carboxylesterase